MGEEMNALIGFAGFGGPEIALREAGIKTVGIEKDYAIAEVNRFNGGNVIRADILDIDPADYIGWLLYHFSPPCPSFSVARNSKALQPVWCRVLDLARHQRSINDETEFDIALARKICEFIRVGRPEYFTLENVWGYRKSQSWHLIQYTLLEEGYGLDVWHLNAADYGVPQSRRRMIVIARRDGRQSAKPWPTHSKTGDMFTGLWRGWYEAIEDLIPNLPESRFAPWQMDRLPDELKTYLVMTANTNRNGVDNVSGRGYLGVDQPANTVNTTGNGSLPRALLIPGGNTSNGVIRKGDEPMVTITTHSPSRCPHRAVILGQGSRSELKKGDEPADTVTANTNQTGVKAFLVGGQYQNLDGKRMPQNLTDERPVWTIVASGNSDTRVLLVDGKVVSMTPRALARFQDFPDSYILPGEPGLDENIILLLDPRPDRELACRGIGNALPPGVYREILRSLDLL